jgi:hypothetical protein
MDAVCEIRQFDLIDDETGEIVGQGWPTLDEVLAAWINCEPADISEFMYMAVLSQLGDEA